MTLDEPARDGPLLRMRDQEFRPWPGETAERSGSTTTSPSTAALERGGRP